MKKIGLVTVLILLVVACAQEQSTSTLPEEQTVPAEAPQDVIPEENIKTGIPTEVIAEPSAETPKTSAESPAQPSKTSAVREFDVEAYRFGFSPDTIEVNQGDTVKITAKSRDVEHGIGIPEFGVDFKFGIAPKTVEFVADKKGAYTFKCSNYCGDGHGNMKGALIVK